MPQLRKLGEEELEEIGLGMGGESVKRNAEGLGGVVGPVIQAMGVLQEQVLVRPHPLVPGLSWLV